MSVYQLARDGHVTIYQLAPPSPPSPPSSPPPQVYTFTNKDALKTAVNAVNADLASAIATYGPVAEWDVSGVSDMSYLFYYLRNFNADISNWDTSSVTDMNRMFFVRSAHALAPPQPSQPGPLPVHMLVRCRRPTLSRLPRPTPRPASYALLSTRQRASAFNQPLSFDTSSVRDMDYMFSVRFTHALAPPASAQPGPLAVHAARELPPAHALPPPVHTPRPASHASHFDSAGP